MIQGILWLCSLPWSQTSLMPVLSSHYEKSVALIGDRMFTLILRLLQHAAVASASSSLTCGRGQCSDVETLLVQYRHFPARNKAGAKQCCILKETNLLGLDSLCRMGLVCFIRGADCRQWSVCMHRCSERKRSRHTSPTYFGAWIAHRGRFREAHPLGLYSWVATAAPVTAAVKPVRPRS